MKHLFLLIINVLLFSLPSSLFSQSFKGYWSGIFTFSGMEIGLDFKIEDSDKGYIATMYSPEQTSRAIPVTEIKITGKEIYMNLAMAGFQYKGTLSEDGKSILGSFTQGTMKESLNLRFQEAPPPGSIDWIRSNFDKQEVYIAMRDGVKLFTSIYTPKDKSTQYPILMTRTPYNIEPEGPEGISRMLRSHITLMQEGYIFAFQDVRGRHMSEGTFEDVRPYNPDKKTMQDIDESSDTYDAIDWLIHNVPNNNGRIGVFGISYPGFYSTMSLLNSHSALKAVSPQAPVTDWFIGDDFHHNGAFFLLDAFNFYSGFGKPRPKPTRSTSMGYRFPNQDNYDFFLKMGALKNAKTIHFGDSILFWNQLMSNPTYNDFWKARNPRPHLKNVKPAVMVIGGLFDAEDCFGAWNTYKAIEKQNPQTLSNKIIMGPWSHGEWARGKGENLGNVHWGMKTGEYYKAAELEFFNFYLKDKGKLTLPEAGIFITGENKWTSFDTWPPVNAEEKTLYFHPKGGLSFNAPKGKNSFDEYISDPNNPVPYTEDVHIGRTTEYMNDDQRFASRRPDVMEYQTEILTEDITLTGPLLADLFVSTSGTDADYVVKLIDVFPDDLRNYPQNDKNVPMAGYQMLVRGEVLRGKFRNSFEKPEPFSPGKVTKVRFELPDVAHTFKKGHRIMIQVQNSWFPLVDRNPQKFVDIYTCNDSDFQKATQRIYHDAAHASGVKVLVLKK